jgi:hypothetical protein
MRWTGPRGARSSLRAIGTSFAMGSSYLMEGTSMTEPHFAAPPRDAALLTTLLSPRARRSPPRSEVHDGWLRVHFGSGEPAHADFHFRWLRDRAERQRGSSAADPPDRLAVVASYVDAEGRLHVQWKERWVGRRVELSESVFALESLRAHAQASAVPPANPLAHVEVDARRVGPHWALREFCFDRLHREGAVVVRAFGRNTEGLIRLFEQSGLAVVETPAGRIEELRADAERGAVAHARAEAPPFVRPPRYRLLHCLEPASRGGELSIVDGLRGARRRPYRVVLGSGDFVLWDDHRMLVSVGSFGGPRWLRAAAFEAEKEESR